MKCKQNCINCGLSRVDFTNREKLVCVCSDSAVVTNMTGYDPV